MHSHHWGDYAKFIEFSRKRLKLFFCFEKLVPLHSRILQIWELLSKTKLVRTKSRIESETVDKNRIEFLVCSKYFRFFYWRPLRFILFATLRVVLSCRRRSRRLVLVQCKFYQFMFFFARRYYCIWIGFEANTKKTKKKIKHELSASEMLCMHAARSA